MFPVCWMNFTISLHFLLLGFYFNKDTSFVTPVLRVIFFVLSFGLFIWWDVFSPTSYNCTSILFIPRLSLKAKRDTS